MDQKKFLDLVRKDGLLGILIALLIYFGTSLQTNQTDLSKQISNIQLKLVEIQNKMVDSQKVEAMIAKALQQHQKIYHKDEKN